MLANNKGFINLRFLQKLNWVKTEWDQARFSDQRIVIFPANRNRN